MNKIDHFRQNHPKIKIELIDMATSKMIEELVGKRLDFIIDSSPIETLKRNMMEETGMNIDTANLIDANSL